MNTNTLETACSNLSAGFLPEGTESIVVVREGKTEKFTVHVISCPSSEDFTPVEVVKSVSEASEIPTESIEVFVYAQVGGAVGRDL